LKIISILLFGAEVGDNVTAFADVSRRFGLCGWLSVAVSGFYAVFIHNTKR